MALNSAAMTRALAAEVRGALYAPTDIKGRKIGPARLAVENAAIEGI
jgi:hypothetical protein